MPQRTPWTLLSMACLGAVLVIALLLAGPGCTPDRGLLPGTATDPADTDAPAPGDTGTPGDDSSPAEPPDTAEEVPEGTPFPWYPDTDGDGYGDEAAAVEAVDAPPGYLAWAGDCDDGDAAVHPGAEEACDGVDQDCDGTLDEGCPGSCGDGLASGVEECDGGDDGACPGACSDLCACPDGPTGSLRVRVVDVGQGDAIVVVSPDGFVLLVDGGGTGSGAAVAAALADMGVDRLDYVLASHLHADHVGGLDEVLAAHPEVVACFDHGGSASSTAASEWRTAAGDRRATARSGRTLDLGSATEVEVLHPSASDMTQNDDNARSVVLRVRHGGTTVLLGGDCPQEGCEEQLDPGPVDIFKVHHHGSAGASSQGFLDRIRPEVALIPVGTNSYGHPAAEAVERLEAAGAEVHRTDHEGDLEVVVTSTGWRLRTGS